MRGPVVVCEDGPLMKLQAHGIETDLPPGWEGRIALRAVPGQPLPNPTGTTSFSAPAEGPATSFSTPLGGGTDLRSDDQAPEAPPRSGSTNGNPLVHLANFALPEQRGDFGSGAVDLMGEDHVLVVLFEYGPECVNTALFKQQGMPKQLTPQMFSSSALQRTLPGQAGCQIFFTEANRAFCCYTVLGRQWAANRVLPQANATLAATRITPR